MYYEIKRLVTEDGKNLSMLVQADGKNGLNPPVTKIQGMVHLETPMGTIPIEFPFPDNIKTPAEAFMVFEDTARAYVRKMQEEAPRVLTPDAGSRVNLQ